VLEPLSAVMITRANVHYSLGLTLADLLVYEDARFAAADTDHDGFLEQDEIEALRGAHGGRHDGARGSGAHQHEAGARSGGD
jgi:hypothetical protein